MRDCLGNTLAVGHLVQVRIGDANIIGKIVRIEDGRALRVAGRPDEPPLGVVGRIIVHAELYGNEPAPGAGFLPAVLRVVEPLKDDTSTDS